MDQLVNRSVKEPVPDLEAELGLDGKGRTKRLRGRMLWVLAVLALGAAGIAGYQWYTSGGERIQFATVPAATGDLTVEVNSTGTLQPLVQVDISSELSGVIRSVPVEENQQVRKGDVLAEMDRERLSAEVERAQASADAARAKLDDTKITLTESQQSFGRTESLTGRGMATQQALEAATAVRDRAQAAVSSAQASLAIAEADLKLAQANLEKSTIYAPIDGVVLTRSVNPGQTVSASTQAPILFVLAADLSKMELKAAIDEADIGGVQKGQQAKFTVDAFPERQFEAEIRDIAYASVTTDNVVTYNAKLDVDNDELLLRPGMTATVSIVTKEAKGVITVPTAAFRYRPTTERAERGGSFNLLSMFTGRSRGPGGPGGRATRPADAGRAEAAMDGTRLLFVLKDGQPTPTRVKTGVSDGDRTEVVSGLAVGDQIVTGSSTVRN
ncbi:efflux RND transporter periplasmic adaptor subunit [Oryzicola mucosus]|nr:efflux RND transporter periplasmic adaptor subunit [Oryzicola mucosus]